MAPNPLADLGAGLSTKSSPLNLNPGPKQHGPLGQTERAITVASTFMSGLMAICAMQFLGAPLKMIDPKFYEAYMAFTKQSFAVLVTTMTQRWAPTVVRVSGDKNIPKQLFKKPDGSLECRFPKRLVMMANHQLYTDWLYLWWVAYTNNMHGYVYIILKESLKNIPIIGWGAQFYNFIFLKRKWEDDRESFKRHLDSLNNEADPMWLLIFPEGTNLAQGTKAKSAEWAKKQGLKDMKHQLLPRSKGLQLCLQNLQSTTEWLYDCTIGYEGIPAGQFGQDIFTLRSSMFEGRPPKSVNMHFRRFKIAEIPVDSGKAFDVWLRNRWREKDYLLEHFAQYNSFPADDRWLFKQQQLVGAGGKNGLVSAKNVQTQIQTSSLDEFLSIFAPLEAIINVLTLCNGNGSLEDMLKTIGEAAAQQQNVQNVASSPIDTSSNRVLTKLAGSTKFSAHADGISSKAQNNVLQPYVAIIRPAVEKQSGLRKDAMESLNAGEEIPSLHPKQKVVLLVQKHPAAQSAATTVPEKPKPARMTTGKAVSAASGKLAARIPTRASRLKRPLMVRTFSSTSTVHPGDSISAIVTPTITTQCVVQKPVPARRTPPKVVKPVPKSKNTRLQPSVSIDPAIMLRVESGQKGPTALQNVRIESNPLAKMKIDGTKMTG